MGTVTDTQANNIRLPFFVQPDEYSDYMYCNTIFDFLTPN